MLCYHNIVAGPAALPWDTRGLHMPLPTFERQVRWLMGAYDVVPLGEFVGRLSRGGSLRGAAALTFDDGFSGVFDHAWPLLRDLRIPATVFVLADAVERDAGFLWDNPEASLDCRPAGWRTIADAAKSGLEVGVHSATHRSLPTLDDRELRREVEESRDVIGRCAGVTPDFFAYPFGHWDRRVRAAVRSAGYRAAFTLEDGPSTADLWALPRVNVPPRIEDAAFHAWSAGLRPRRRSRS